MSRGDWIRVERLPRAHRQCPVCHNDHVCMIHKDWHAAICFRVREGAKTDRQGEPIAARDGMGWVHDLRSEIEVATPPVRIKPEKPPSLDCDARARKVWRACDWVVLCELSEATGIPPLALEMLAPGFDKEHWGWAFPMRDHARRIIGFRVRTRGGRKFAIAGSRNGLFIPDTYHRKVRHLCIAEGPTDTAALLSAGLCTIGRSHNTGGVELIQRLLQRQVHKPEVLIVADRDDAGGEGARKLAREIFWQTNGLKVIQPPEGINDARQWLLDKGMTAKTVKAMASLKRYWRKEDVREEAGGRSEDRGQEDPLVVAATSGRTGGHHGQPVF